jgi:hypothetical protein
MTMTLPRSGVAVDRALPCTFAAPEELGVGVAGASEATAGDVAGEVTAGGAVVAARPADVVDEATVADASDGAEQPPSRGGTRTASAPSVAVHRRIPPTLPICGHGTVMPPLRGSS